MMKKGMLALSLIVLAAVWTVGCNKADKENKNQNTADVREGQSDSDWVTTGSGLKYLDQVVGEGEEAATGMTVEMHYTGWLWENGQRGKKFDSSYDHGQPFSFQLGAGRVIPGWDEGVFGMKVGGQRELIIPPELAYGSRGAGNVIPPDATLDFEVEFVRVINK